MKADTWMPFYVGDYLADTLTLTTRQHGAYLLLILACWKGGGFVPNDDETLAAITKLGLKEWQHDKPKLARYFHVSTERWTHDRVERELADALRHSQAASNAGRRGAAKRWHSDRYGDGMAEPSNPQSRTDAPSPSPSPNDLTTTLPASSSYARALPDDWQPSEDDIRAVKAGRPDLTDAQITAETERFRNHAKANARTAHNWGPNWRNWMTKSKPAEQSSETWNQKRIREAKEAMARA